MNGFEERVAKVRTLLEDQKLNAIVVRQNPNLAWLTGGRVHVAATLDQACFDLIITANSVTAVVNSIEAPRLLEEEFPIGIEVDVIPWYESSEAKLPMGNLVGSDLPGADRKVVGNEIEFLRQSLVKEDVERIRLISSQCAVALGAALRETVSEDREIDVAGRITQALWRVDLEVVYLGVGGQSRVHRFRHALPSRELIGNRAVASICARRKGLIASVTRIVTFGDLSTEKYSDYLALLRVEAAMLDATKIGAPFSDAVDAAISAYPANGFADDEWTKHHQGGPAGYLPRDWTAHKGSDQKVQSAQPIAWNPTGKGWKVEDTFLTHVDGVELLSVDEEWPQVSIAGRNRPDILKKR